MSGKSPGGGNGNPLHPVFLPGKSHGRRRLAGYSPWGHNESDTTERLHFISFYMTYDAERLSINLSSICISLTRCLFRSFVQFWIRLFIFLLLSFEFFLYFGEQSFITCVFCKYFLPVWNLSSHSFDRFFHRAEIFNSNEFQLFSFFMNHTFVIPIV